MKITPLHRWDLTAAEALALQTQLAASLDVTKPLGEWRTLAAADVSFDRDAPDLYAAVVVVERGTLNIIERVAVAAPAAFPYVPGLLSFREAPALLAAFEQVQSEPDVILCDGQGIAHPRRLGIASHLGLWLQRPTIGCAKSLLYGKYAEPGTEKGSKTPLLGRKEVIGTVLRSRTGVKPLFISPGHLCDLASAEQVVTEVTGRYRLPIPSRMAHDYVNEIRRKAKVS